MSKQHVRAAFRRAVFARDGYRCVLCGKAGFDRQGGDGHLAFHAAAVPLTPLDAHHIVSRKLMPHGGYVAANGVSLCDDCHLQAESSTPGPGFTPAELFIAIGSSQAAAVADSERLLG